MLALGLLSLSSVVLLPSFAFALPALKRDVTVLSSAEVSSYKPYTYFAKAAYCTPAQTLSWSCGGACRSPSPKAPGCLLT